MSPLTQMCKESLASHTSIHTDAGHSRGGLVGQVEEQAVRQVEVEGVAHAANLVGEGLG